jgi:hypothetical protein
LAYQVGTIDFTRNSKRKKVGEKEAGIQPENKHAYGQYQPEAVLNSKAAI